MTESALAPLPPRTAQAVHWVNASLKTINRWFMVPLLRRGLGAWIATPVGGYILLLRVRGRRSGQIRETPLSYLIEDGSAWVLAGFGTRTEWYRNMLVAPEVDVVLPGGTVRCRGEEVTDPPLRDRMLPRVARAAGLPGLLIGCNPFTSTDERIVAQLTGVPLVALTPIEQPLAAGPDDPGGRAWIWRQGVVALAMLGLARAIRRAVARAVPRRGRAQPAG